MRKRTNRMQAWKRCEQYERLFIARQYKRRARLAREQESREYRTESAFLFGELKSRLGRIDLEESEEKHAQIVRLLRLAGIPVVD